MAGRHAKLEGMAYALAARSSRKRIPDLDNEAMALAEEAGEVAGAIRRGRPSKEVIAELGDVLRRVAAIASLIGHSLRDVEDAAAEKMESRLDEHAAAKENTSG